MDLIEALSSKLGVSPEQAQAVAGGVLGLVKDKVADAGGADAASQLEQAVPELQGWQAQASALAGGGGGGGLGGLLGMASSSGLLGALGGQAQESAALVAVLTKVGLDAGTATTVAPLVWSFLKDRLPPEWVAMAAKAAPFLSGGGGGGLGLPW
ncbi:MAG: DUF2780 domain-containing protein [Alphaproteobacteria bacterium]|nr:DUF2780 domain-containing protein [Alphaproteobacteria bacterium]